MAKVLVKLKVFPEGLDVDLKGVIDEVKKRLPKGYDLVQYGEEPIAFGLKALILHISMPEQTTGGTETLENIIKEVKGVSQVEVEMVTRIS